MHCQPESGEREMTPEQERFLTHVSPEPNTGCWLWTAAVDRGGYGLFKATPKMVRAPKYSYEMHVGSVPEGLQIDHLCRARSCVNPDHLEPVTPKENTRRSPIHCGSRTHCPQGHPLSGDNLYKDPSGKRRCRKCRSAESKRRNALIRHAQDTDR